jgi:hypothetical protein
MFATLVSYTALVASIPILSSPQELPVTSLNGFYVDRASYEPGDVIKVCASWPSKHVRYRVLRAGFVPDAAPDEWEPIAFPSEEYDYDYPQVPPYGSFVDFSAWPVLSATGRSNWTIEGWVYPTYIAPSTAPVGHADDRDVVCIAGQLKLNGSGQVQGVGLGIDKSGLLFAAVQTGTNTVSTLATEPGSGSLALNAWHYVALVYDKNVSPSLKLYRFTPGVSTCIELIASANPSDSISTLSTSLPFRIGARAEAPGDLTGCADGRFDRWGAWAVSLTANKLNYLVDQGLSASVSCTLQWPNFNNRLVFLDFEHAYDCQSQAIDSSGYHRNGTIVNHGALGVSGAPNTAHGIRLNHDQVIDAAFDVEDPGAPVGSAPVASIAIPSTCGDAMGEWRSGYYAIQAVFRSHLDVEPSPGTYIYDPHSAENTAPENFTCFVVRPGDTCPAEAIAVLVPTNTWLAYTPWPGEHHGSEVPGFCAGGLTQRRQPGPATEVFVEQGNNSVYGVMGDGAASIFMGWRRPSALKTSILIPTSNNSEASLDGELFEWLEHPVGGIWPAQPGQDPSIPYSAYADADLDDGACDLSRHEVLMIIGHSEYWSEAMMNRVKEFLDQGGNIVTIGGNLMAWRSEMFTSACGTDSENKVIEVKKWPRAEFLTVPGVPDTESVKDFQKTGSWRHILQCRGELDSNDPSKHDDYVLGVAGDITGNGCDSTHVGGRGHWRVQDSLHWLWDGDVAPDEILAGVGLVVGEEVDSYVCSEGTLESPGDPCPSPGPGQFPDTLPAWGSFPFSLAGKVSILAHGMDFFLDSTCAYAKVPWCNPKFSVPVIPGSSPPVPDTGQILQDCTQVGSFYTPNQSAMTDDTHGSIVFYRFAKPDPIEGRIALGYVLTVGSIQSPLGLRQEPLANSSVPNNKRFALSRVVERALKCMVLGDCGTSPPPLSCDLSR